MQSPTWMMKTPLLWSECLAVAPRQGFEGDTCVRKIGYLISMVGLLLVFTVKIGQTHRGAGGCRECRRVQRIRSHKRDEWLQNLRD